MSRAHPLQDVDAGDVVASVSHRVGGTLGRTLIRVEEERHSYRTVVRWGGHFGPCRRVLYEGSDREEALDAWRAERDRAAAARMAHSLRVEVEP